MSGKPLVDASLLREAEALFANTEEIVIAAFLVLKVRQQGESTGAQLLKALGAKTFIAKEAPQPRLLVFTVRRSKQTRGFKSSLHTCKPPEHHDLPALLGPAAIAASGAAAAASTAGAVVPGTKSFPLKSLTEVLVPAAKYEQHPSHLLELRFSGAGSYSARGEVVNQFKLRNGEEVQLVLALIVQLLSNRLPRFSGVEAGEVLAWWLRHQVAVLPCLGPFAAEVLRPGGGEGGDDTERSGGGGGRVLLSGKEERELEELLDMFAVGVGEVGEFQRRLAEEHEALEAANVHAIMCSVPAAETVVAGIRKTQSLLDDLDETLLVFDTKLRHMREDIAAIETSNNTLDLTSRNNNRLLTTLQDFLTDLRLAPELEATLEAPPFGKDSRLSTITRAAWQLHAKLRKLEPGAAGGLSSHLLDMRVAQEARTSLRTLSGRFVSSALNHLRTLVSGAVEEVLGGMAASTDKASRLVPPSHDRLRAACLRHSELVRAVAALEPEQLPKLHATYCQAVNMLLRKELRVSVAELRKAATLDMQVNPIDYNLTASSTGRGTTAGAAGSVMGSRGPPGSVIASSEDNERDEAASVGASSEANFGLGPGMGFGGGPLSSASKHSRSTFRSAVSRAGETSSMAIPLHEAWQGLLEGYLPHLLGEAGGAADFLLLGRGELKAVGEAGGGGALAPNASEDFQSGGNGDGVRKKKDRRRGRKPLPATPAAVAAEGGGGGGGPRALSRAGRQVEESLLAGVDAEFMVLVDLTAKSHQVLCLPLMAVTTQCINALGSRGAVAGPLRAMLAACHARLKGHFARFVEAQKAAVEGYATRLATAGSVKSHHVVNFVAQFALMAHHIEVMLSQSVEGLIMQLSGDVADTLRDVTSAVTTTTTTALAAARGAGGGGVSGGGMGMTAGRGGRGMGVPGAGGSEEEEGEGEGEEEGAAGELMRRREVVAAAAGWQVRPEVDAVYASLVGLIFTSLERIAAADPKHGDRLRAENYAYFVEAVRPLVRHVAALEPYMLQAEAKQEEAVSRYVSSQVQYTTLGRLLEAGERLEGLLALVTPGEVPYQAGFSAADMKSLIATTMKDVDKKVASMYARVRKHMGNSNLTFRVWQRIYEQLMQRYERLDEQLALCYPTLTLKPSVAELEEVFRSAGPSAVSP